MAEHLQNEGSGDVFSLTGSEEDVVVWTSPADSTGGVAIVGMSCRFPGSVGTPAAFWELLQSGRETSSMVPFERWDKDVAGTGLSEEARLRSLHGSFVSNLELFDAGFFGISPAEAKAMDPQQRLLLEGVELALADAGLSRADVQGKRCGVFVGIAAGAASSSMASSSVYAANSGTASTAAGRISFVFDLHGPCAAYDTACSSSLVALACCPQSALVRRSNAISPLWPA